MFHPLPLYEFKRETRRFGLFFLMHILEIREALVPKGHENIERLAEGADL
jgi:hypothetical protein